jgi:hypothetical protein
MIFPGRRDAGQVVVLLLIVLAIGAGLAWWLFASRAQSEQAAFAFARLAGVKLGREHDAKFLNVHIGREVQTRFPPSFRDRLLNHLRELGVASEQVEAEGTVSFTSTFFEPRGRFRVQLFYPNSTKAELYLTISNRPGWWQIDDINLVWSPPEKPAAEIDPAAPTAAPVPTAP